MSRHNTIEVIQKHLFSDEDTLLKAGYDNVLIARIKRLHHAYNYVLGHPAATDKEIVNEIISAFSVQKTAAYSDLSFVKIITPMLGEASRNYHRWKTNEMLLETYAMAKRRKDTRTMEKAASSYAKYNRVDIEDETKIPYDEIVVQPFTATDDPSILGIKPIANINQKKKELLEKYRKESIDIEDVEFEEADLEELQLFPDEMKEQKEELHYS